MLFCNISQHQKTKKMTKLKVVMAIVVFIALSNGSILNNLLNIFNGSTPNLLNIERFLTDILNIGKIISESCFISNGLEFIFIQLTVIVLIAFVLFMSFKWSFGKKIYIKIELVK